MFAMPHDDPGERDLAFVLDGIADDVERRPRRFLRSARCNKAFDMTLVDFVLRHEGVDGA